MAKKPNIRILRPGQKSGYDKERSNLQVLRRTTGIMIFCSVVLFALLIGQLFRVMILDHEYYESKAIDNQTRSTAVSADRGTIYDRNMNALAASTTVENVFIDPLEINRAEEDVQFIAQNLGRILSVEPSFILEQAADVNMRYKVIARKQPLEIAQAVRAFINENQLTGIHLESDSQRYYPYGTLAAQVIGFTNAENRGSEGLEAYYDNTLQGTAGAVITTKGNYETEMLFSFEKYYEATNGNSLVLTLDATVQYYLEKNLQAAIAKYDVQHGAFGIVMDVNTGAILAMATEGGYDPNNYLEILDERVLEDLDKLSQEMDKEKEGTAAYQALADQYNQEVVSARLSQWRNRCVSDGYEPGSTFKTITLAAALEEGAVSLDNTFYCGGEKDYPGRDDTLHCWQAYGHGTQNTAQALQNSCNIAFADMGLLLGGEKLYDYIDAFGMLERTKIDMSGEGWGVFHTKERMSENAQLTTVAFGQSVKPTPIQMVRAIAAVVNGGYVLKPYVVEEILDADGNVIQKNGKTVLRQAISEDTSRLMCQLIESVVTDGTAGNAEIPGYRVGGKTGTSEKLDVYDEDGNLTEDKIVSFVGIAPMDKPQYIVLVALDTPSTKTGIYISGGVMAAPVVRDIFSDTLLYLGVQPDYTDVDMRTVNVQMPELRDLNEAEAAELLAAQSLTYITVGTGAEVTGQIPDTGAMLPGNSQVILYMGEPVPKDKVPVPNFANMTRAQAQQAAANVGLYLQTKGSSAGKAVATSQDWAAGEEVPLGTTITCEFTDPTAQD